MRNIYHFSILAREKPQRHALCCVGKVSSCTGMYPGSHQMRQSEWEPERIEQGVCVSIVLMDRGGEAMSGGQEEHAPAPLCFSERHRKIMTTFSHQRFQLGSMAASGSW